ncbi:MAG: enolase C-terminal domain-like protein [Acidimicrobiia bacterium]
MRSRIAEVRALDVRFPTSREGIGSDAMHPDPDYSLAYVTIRTDGDDPEGNGFTFTLGRGTEVVVAAIRALAVLVEGLPLAKVLEDTAGLWRRLTHDGQLRWLGPDKGVIHLATAALVNAVWDLKAKLAGKPLWEVLCDLSPEELVTLVDFRYLEDVLPKEEALDLLEDRSRRKGEREAALRREGLPGYATSPGWIGYPDDRVVELARQAVGSGFRHIKIKVGRNPGDDVRRASLVREAIGPGVRLMLDANQRWSVPEALAAIPRLAPFEPWWVEEPTSPDDVLGHARIARAVAPIRLAVGEHLANRVMFKQYLQAGAMAVCQADPCRLGGINEVLAVLLLAARFDVPVCPHAGGVGLCEYARHLAAFDAVAVGGSRSDRVVEWVDHLHEHFLDPAVVRGGHYLLPEQPGYSADLRPETLHRYRFPGGEAWQEAAAAKSR